MRRMTLFGGQGFLGSALAAELRLRGYSVICQPRDSIHPRIGGFGTLIWCIGLTANFRTRPIDTATAHVGLLAEVLAQGAHDRVIYLSSTRVYGGAESTSEDGALAIRPGDPSDLYNATKLAGEALVLTATARAGVVVRLSNVVGPSEAGRATFLGAISRQAIDGLIELESAPETAKDYIWITDAARALADIAISGGHRIYNLGRGVQITHADWTRALARATDCGVVTRQGARDQSFPPIDTTRLTTEFDFVTENPLDRIADILKLPEA